MPLSPEELEFQSEEHKLATIVSNYPDSVTFHVPSGGATALRVRLKRALKNFVLNTSWPSALDRRLAHKILGAYTFVADDKHHLYCGYPRRSRTPLPEAVCLELPPIVTEEIEVLRAIFLLKNLDHIPLPIKVQTSLPIHDIKQDYYNTEIAVSIQPDSYTIL